MDGDRQVDSHKRMPTKRTCFRRYQKLKPPNSTAAGCQKSGMVNRLGQLASRISHSASAIRVTLRSDFNHMRLKNKWREGPVGWRPEKPIKWEIVIRVWVGSCSLCKCVIFSLMKWALCWFNLSFPARASGNERLLTSIGCDCGLVPQEGTNRSSSRRHKNGTYCFHFYFDKFAERNSSHNTELAKLCGDPQLGRNLWQNFKSTMMTA